MEQPTQTACQWDEAAEEFAEYLEAEGKSPFTTKNYLHDLKMFCDWHTGCYGYPPEPVKIKPIDFFSYRAYLQTDRRQSPSTVNRRVAALKRFADFLHQRKITSENIGRGVGYLQTPEQKAPDVFAHADVLRLLKTFDRTKRMGKRDYAIIQLFLQCGLRLKELCDIQLRDVRITERTGELKIPAGKGGRPREIPLNKTAREAIMDYLAVRPSTRGVRHLFYSQKRRPLAPRSIQDIVKKHLEMAGLGKYSCHSLRHLFATNLYNKHKDILLVKEALGHKQLVTTLRYSHKTKKEIQDALEDSPLNIMK